MLRFPPGLRDRIKAYAERNGTSINSEIIRILEIEFPEQWPVEDKLTELGELLSVLAAGRSDPRFAEFSNKLEETISGILSGRVYGVDRDTRAAIEAMWSDYKTRESEAAYDNSQDHQWGRTEEEIAAYEATGNYEKYKYPLPRPADPLKDNFYLMDILPPSALAALTEKLEEVDINGAIEVLKSVPEKEIRRRIEFQKLPITEQYRLRGEIPPDRDDDDLFSFAEEK